MGDIFKYYNTGKFSAEASKKDVSEEEKQDNLIDLEEILNIKSY